MNGLPPINPRRMYRGTGLSAGAINNFVGLYNASAGDRLLVVFGYILTSQTGSRANAFNYQGVAGAKVMNGIPVLSSEGAGSGQIFNGATPATIVTDWSNFFLSNTPISWMNAIPIAVLPPGWMFGFTNGASAVANAVSFLWQEMLPDELLAIPG